MMAIRSLFLAWFCVGAAALGAPTHVLFVAVDDLRPELGCYDAQHMRTPHIDRLARSGLLLRRAYCQQAICAPSRISLMTGLRPDSTGIYDLEKPLEQHLPDALTLAEHFHRSGFKTISLGKIYHHSRDDAAFWDVLDSCSAPPYAEPSTRRLLRRLAREADALGLRGKAHRNHRTGPATEAADVSDSRFAAGIIADRAIAEIRGRGDRRLFLGVGFRKPHLPFVAPKKYWDLYDREAIAVPDKSHPEGAADQAFTNWGELRKYHDIPERGDVPDDLARKLIHGYRACVSYVDAQLGRILAELEQQRLLDDTLIVLWGDHGWKLGDYGDWSKHTNFELDTRVPLIFSGPGVPAGVRSDALVELVDVFPTLAESCGLTPPVCDGVSLVPLFTDPSQGLKHAAFSQYPRRGGMGYSVRSANWRYTQWRDRRGEAVAHELYDHSDSPVAKINLYEHAAYAEVASELRSLLEGALRVPGD